jgi:hypothetical protein
VTTEGERLVYRMRTLKAKKRTKIMVDYRKNNFF